MTSSIYLLHFVYSVIPYCCETSAKWSKSIPRALSTSHPGHRIVYTAYTEWPKISENTALYNSVIVDLTPLNFIKATPTLVGEAFILYL